MLSAGDFPGLGCIYDLSSLREMNHTMYDVWRQATKRQRILKGESWLKYYQTNLK
ncbi:MAG: hypothetical protein ACHBN1_25770 [Heteroscytonema crispum UTEX LB 1556]